MSIWRAASTAARRYWWRAIGLKIAVKISADDADEVGREAAETFLREHAGKAERYYGARLGREQFGFETTASRDGETLREFVGRWRAV